MATKMIALIIKAIITKISLTISPGVSDLIPSTNGCMHRMVAKMFKTVMTVV